MLRRQAAELIRSMRDWLRDTFAQGGHLARQGGLRLREVLGRGAAKRAHVAALDRQVTARNRFWSDLRSGQREAAARSGDDETTAGTPAGGQR